jgi:hypothetical protein
MLNGSCHFPLSRVSDSPRNIFRCHLYDNDMSPIHLDYLELSLGNYVLVKPICILLVCYVEALNYLYFRI